MTGRPCELGCCWVGLRGLEPRTSSLSDHRSDLLRPAHAQVGHGSRVSLSDRMRPSRAVRSGTVVARPTAR
jgi:hypothetical protein